MKLDQLIKIVDKSKKRLGRGIGSGRGKTAGRGTKGQKARGKIPQSFIGGALPLFRKLPLVKGKGNMKAAPKPLIVNLNQLNNLKSGVVDAETLVKAGIVSRKDSKKGIKILGNGAINNKLTVKLPASVSAQQSIEKAGGKVEW